MDYNKLKLYAARIEMDTPRIKMGHLYGETPTNIFPDFDWVRRNEKELLAKYGECSIIVYEQKVIGVGQSYKEALEDAERNLPSDVEKITPIHQWLHYRHPILRVRPTTTTDKA